MDWLNGFAALFAENKLLSPEQAEILVRAMKENLKTHEEHMDRLNQLDAEFLRGNLPLNEMIEEKRELGCFEKNLTSLRNTKDTDSLVEDGILEHKENRISIAEPLHLSPWKVFLKRKKHNGQPISNRIYKTIVKLLNTLGTISYVPDRRDLVNRATLGIGNEECVIHSRTPAIFNPFEDLRIENNYTKSFSRALLNTEKQVIYVWNKDACLTQIRTHLESYRTNMTQEDLMDKYYDRLYPFTEKGHIDVYVGDNSRQTEGDMSLAYMSPEVIILGQRPEEKIEQGFVISFSVLETIIGKIPIIKHVDDVIADILSAYSFKKAKQTVLENETLHLVELGHPRDVSNFISGMFNDALAGS